MPEATNRGSRLFRVAGVVLAALGSCCLVGSAWLGVRVSEIASLNRAEPRPTVIEDTPTLVRLRSPGDGWDLLSRETMSDLEPSFVIGAMRHDEMIAVSVRRAIEGMSNEDTFAMIPNAGVLEEPRAYQLQRGELAAVRGALATEALPDRRMDVVIFVRDGAQFRIVVSHEGDAEVANSLLDAIELLPGTVDVTAIPGSPRVDDTRYATIEQGLLDLDGGLLVRTDGPWLVMPCVDEGCVGMTVLGDRGSRLDVGVGRLAHTEGPYNADLEGAARHARILGYDVPFFTDEESEGWAYGSLATRGRSVELSVDAQPRHAERELTELAAAISLVDEETLARERARRERGHRLVPGAAFHDGVLFDPRHSVRWDVPRGTVVETAGEILRFARPSLEVEGEVEVVDSVDEERELDHFAVVCEGAPCPFVRTEHGALVTYDGDGDVHTWHATARSGERVLRASVWWARDTDAPPAIVETVHQLIDGMSPLATHGGRLTDVRFGYSYRGPGRFSGGSADPEASSEGSSGMTATLPNAEVRIRAFAGRPGWLRMLVRITRDEELHRGRPLWLDRVEGDVEIAHRPAHYVEVSLFGWAQRVYELYDEGMAYVVAVRRNDACQWSWQELVRGFRIVEAAHDDTETD